MAIRAPLFMFIVVMVQGVEANGRELPSEMPETALDAAELIGSFSLLQTQTEISTTESNLEDTSYIQRVPADAHPEVSLADSGSRTTRSIGGKGGKGKDAKANASSSTASSAEMTRWIEAQGWVVNRAAHSPANETEADQYESRIRDLERDLSEVREQLSSVKAARAAETTTAQPATQAEMASLEETPSFPFMIAGIYLVASLIITVWAVRCTHKNVYMTTISLLVCIAHLGVHMLFEGWAFTTALYVGVQVATTIGYGDITPSTTAGRVASMFGIIWALVALSYVLNKIVSSVVTGSSAVTWKNWRRATYNFVAAISVGTVIFATIENCTCSYGQTAASATCIDTTYAECVESGGFVKTWFEAVYLSVMTLTTVGFGDFTPLTLAGRAAGCVWMLLGVAITGNWILATSAMMFEQDQGDPQKSTDEMFKLLDTDGDGCLNQLDCYMFELMKQGILSEEKMQELGKKFSSVQKNPAGLVTYEALQHTDHMCQD